MRTAIGKFVFKQLLKIICFQFKRNGGLGKEFQHGLDTKNITADFGEKQVMFLPVHIHVNIEKDKYYFTHNGILVGGGNLDRLNPVDIIRQDCIEYGVLYQYFAAYAINDKIIMNKILNDEVLFNYLNDEVLQLVQLAKKKTA